MLPKDSKARKEYPLATGVLDYFPDALVEVAHVSFVGNEQHNPGQPLHWAKEKSTDEPDALLRHLKDRGTLDTDGCRHSAKVAWRALALLQRELDAEKLGEVEGSNPPKEDVPGAVGLDGLGEAALQEANQPSALENRAAAIARCAAALNESLVGRLGRDRAVTVSLNVECGNSIAEEDGQATGSDPHPGEADKVHGVAHGWGV